MQELGLGALTLGHKYKHLTQLRQQLLNIAITLKENSLILMDEPAAELASGEVEELHSILRHLIGQGHTIVITEHDPLLIDAAGHRIELGPTSGPRGGHLL